MIFRFARNNVFLAPMAGITDAAFRQIYNLIFVRIILICLPDLVYGVGGFKQPR